MNIRCYDSDGDPIHENMLATLLLSDDVFINDHWWEKSWSDDARKTFSLCINVNDVFAPGADAEEFNYEELEEVFRFYMNETKWGLILWVMKKRGIFETRFNDKIEKDIGMTIQEFIGYFKRDDNVD